MKKFSYIFVAFAALFMLNATPLHAQTVVLYDQFDSGDGKWNTGWIEGSTSVTFSIDTNGVLSGKNSYLANIVSASSTTYFIQRNADCPLLAGKIYTVSFKAVANTDSASINVLFELAGDPYTKRLNETPTITTTPQVITYTMTSTENVPTNQLKLHYGGTQNNNTKIWVDSVIVTYEDDPSLVSQWGATTDGYGTAWANGMLNDSSTAAGDAGITGVQPMPSGTNGASLLGRFNTLQVTTGQTIVVSGQLEYVGGGMGSVYTPLRYALTNLDSLTLENQYTDSAKWVSTRTNGSQNHHYGWEFTPRSLNGQQPNGGAGNGSVWQVKNGNWASTYSNGGGTVGPVVDQAPRNAELSAGTYNWAISVQQINDTTDEIRWYIEAVHAAGEQASYWFGGIAQDTTLTNKLNGVAFWLKDGEATQFNVIDAYIDLGNPIEIPPKPWQKFYIPAELWGFYSSTGGWQMSQPDVDGNTSISGSGPIAADQWASVRGGFGRTINFSDLPPDTALVVTGDLEFVGGGFDGWSGLRFGLFYSDSAGVVDSTANGPMWSGTEAYSSGYLFCPNSGTNANPTWSGPGADGNVGGVINSTWLSTNGADNYILSNDVTSDVAGANTYHFILGFKDMGNGQIGIGYSIKSDSYTLEGVMTDDHDPLATTKFNAINFSISSTNATTTGLNISNVLVDVASVPTIGVIDNKDNSLPTVYSLSQNYPNPFNPTTNIKFGLPQAGDVSLVVYDILGRKVAELVHGNLAAGYHIVNFNATNLASGVYFYRIKAGDFVSVKKLMLLK